MNWLKLFGKRDTTPHDKVEKMTLEKLLRDGRTLKDLSVDELLTLRNDMTLTGGEAAWVAMEVHDRMTKRKQ